MLMNRRIHLSSSDVDSGNPPNHANVEFNLSRGNFKVDTPLELSMGLVKAMIPPDISLMGTSEEFPVFEIVIEQVVVAPFTSQNLYFYFTKNKYEFPYGVGNMDSVYIPMTHIDSVETFIGIVNEAIRAVTGSPTTLLAIDNIDNTLTATSSINNLFIPMSLYNPKIASTETRDAYRPQNTAIMRMLGINIDIQSPETATRLGKDIVNRDVKYPVGLYMPPLLLRTNLSLNSVSSNNRISGKILTSINCDVAVSSETFNFNFTPHP